MTIRRARTTTTPATGSSRGAVQRSVVIPLHPRRHTDRTIVCMVRARSSAAAATGAAADIRRVLAHVRCGMGDGLECGRVRLVHHGRDRRVALSVLVLLRLVHQTRVVLGVARRWRAVRAEARVVRVAGRTECGLRLLVLRVRLLRGGRMYLQVRVRLCRLRRESLSAHRLVRGGVGVARRRHRRRAVSIRVGGGEADGRIVARW